MKKIDQVASDALDAFWTVVSHNYPEAVAGDFPADANEEFAKGCDRAVKIWVATNVK